MTSDTTVSTIFTIFRKTRKNHQTGSKNWTPLRHDFLPFFQKNTKNSIFQKNRKNHEKKTTWGLGGHFYTKKSDEKKWSKKWSKNAFFHLPFCMTEIVVLTIPSYLFSEKRDGGLFRWSEIPQKIVKNRLFFDFFASRIVVVS